MKLLALALAPGLTLLAYIYLKDKYEREPLRQILKAFLLGAASAVFILLFWLIIKTLDIKDLYSANSYIHALYQSFLYAAIPEELVKFSVFMLFIYKIADFNEWFDGIVYASAISLGFATVENILYVTSNGMSVGFMRAVFAVPSHFIDGVTQGFFFALAKFSTKRLKLFYITFALFSAIVVHGIYDFILMLDRPIFLTIFIAYFILIVFLAKKLIKKHLEKSQFKAD